MFCTTHNLLLAFLSYLSLFLIAFCPWGLPQVTLATCEHACSRSRPNYDSFIFHASDCVPFCITAPERYGCVAYTAALLFMLSSNPSVTWRRSAAALDERAKFVNNNTSRPATRVRHHSAYCTKFVLLCLILSRHMFTRLSLRFAQLAGTT
jgi:hypothetical protein